MASISHENFAIELAGAAKTHESWLGVVNFGMQTLLKDPGLLTEIIVREAVRMKLERPSTYSEADCAREVMSELRLRFVLTD